MLGGKRPRVFTFLSTLKGSEKAGMLTNLCSSLAAAGSDVVLLDACGQSRGVAALFGTRMPSLLDVAMKDIAYQEALVRTGQGFAAATVFGTSSVSIVPDQARGPLEQTFHELAEGTGIVVIDSECDGKSPFPLDSMAHGDIVVQVTPAAESITEAYGTIKRLNAQLGRRPFSILVTGATEQEAAKVFDNMSLAANRYLAVTLDFIGSVPADDHLSRAAGLGRPVTDAFPLAGASVAFRRLAQRFALSDTWREASPRI